MKNFASIVLCAVLIVGVLSGCVSVRDPRQLDEKQIQELAEMGSSSFGIQWNGKLVGARERGVMAVTDGVTTLTTRAGSRTFIVHDRKDFPPSDSNEFKGSDEELKNLGKRFLMASGAKPAEIADLRILQQLTQVGERIGGSGDVQVHEAQNSSRTLLIGRRIDGIDVLSSRLVLHANSAGRIAFMELNWPDLGSEVLERAARLREIAGRGYVAPPLKNAEVESVQPVLLHSPAVGFYNDTTAAIRVIYRPTGEEGGKKAVRYLNERGEDVALPRDLDVPREKPVTRPVARQ